MSIPLADRMRPKTLDEIVGQRHLFGENRVLRNIIESGHIPNLIFYGPSGTGKTTQLKHWDRLYHDEVCILNGDKPILEVTSGKDILVHPSPWKGKEGYGRDDITAPLEGIILLKQEKENSIELMETADAASALFGRIYSTFNTEKEVLTAGTLIEKILKKTPVWLLKNRGDEMSATMTHDFLSKEIRP